jgi:hypothetical protein
MILIAAALACALTSPPRTDHRRKPSHPPAASVSAGPSVMQERALRRRLVRLARIKMLERRQAMLFDFLAKTHTESPLFEDTTVFDIGGGIVIGPTSVTLDFLGSPIVRTTVRNASKARVSPVLTVHLRMQSGDELRASTALDALEPGASRTVDMLCPSRGHPVSATWSAILLAD